MSWLMIFFPIVCGLIGLSTNWLALRMMFRPVHEVSVFGLFKYQGIVPSSLPKFAKMIANVVENELIQMDDIADSVDVAALLKNNREAIIELIGKVYLDNKNRIPEKYQAFITDETLKLFQEKVFDHMLIEAPKSLKLFMEHGQEKVGIRNYILDRLLDFEPDIMEKIVYGIASREIRYIVAYGAIFGGILGFMQFGLYMVGAPFWLMPIVGGFVGLITNFLALIMLWLPTEPKRILGFTLQGAIPGRKFELLDNIQEIIAKDFLVLPELISLMIDQINEEIISQNFDYQLDSAIPKNIPEVSPILSQALSDTQKQEMRAWVVKEIMDNMTPLKDQVSEYVDKNFDVLEIMRAEPQATVDEFMTFLQEVLSSEAAMIVVLGGLLGAAVGGLQIFFI